MYICTKFEHITLDRLESIKNGIFYSFYYFQLVNIVAIIQPINCYIYNIYKQPALIYLTHRQAIAQVLYH